MSGYRAKSVAAAVWTWKSDVTACDCNACW